MSGTIFAKVLYETPFTPGMLSDLSPDILLARQKFSAETAYFFWTDFFVTKSLSVGDQMIVELSSN